MRTLLASCMSLFLVVACGASGEPSPPDPAAARPVEPVSSSVTPEMITPGPSCSAYLCGKTGGFCCGVVCCPKNYFCTEDICWMTK